MTSPFEYAVLARNAYDVAVANRIALPGWDQVNGLGGSGWGGFADQFPAPSAADVDDLVQRFAGQRKRILRHFLPRMWLAVPGAPVE